ncbi:hypothetical protein [Rhodopirellula europaea]|uniref:hypothetical protein n=1 Tax=Rhodopirellula europaea TaxID=1263866 RepID=UPI003D29D180
MPDFILAGPRLPLTDWPVAARQAGVFRCFNSREHNAPSADCDHSFGCGLADSGTCLNVFEIAEAQGFNNSDHEFLLLATPCKKDLNDGTGHQLSLVVSLLKKLDSNEIQLYESRRLAGGSSWVEVDYFGDWGDQTGRE